MNANGQSPESLMLQAENLPYGQARTVLVERALQLSESAGDPLGAMAARLELITCYRFGGEPRKVFGTFARCLADYDASPARYDPWVDYSLRWDYKWLASLMLEYPEITLAQTYSALDEMENRYRAGGFSLQAVYQRREAVARHIGDVQGSDRWYAQWVAAPRDENSDCAGCEPTSRIAHLTWRGRDEEAVALAAPVLGGELRCREQPQEILTNLMFAYLRTNRHDNAVHAHRQAYRAMRSLPDELGSIGKHVQFCALTGNESRGLEILERHLPWLDKTSTPDDSMRFAAAGALLLRRLEETGHGDVIVRRPGKTEHDAPEEISVAQLGLQLRVRAMELSDQFDLRNGTANQGRWIRSIIDARPMMDFLPLTPHGRLVVRPLKRVQPPPERGREVPALEGLSPAQLLDDADELWRRRRVEDAEPHLRRFDQLAAVSMLPAILEARRADLRGAELVTSGDVQGGAALWDRAARLYADAGDEERRQQALGRLGTLRVQAGAIDEGVALVEESTEYLLDSSSPSIRAAASIRLARSYLIAGRFEEALDIADQSTRLARYSSYPIDRADAAFFRAQLLATNADRAGEAMVIAEEARLGYRGQDPAAMVWACLLHGELLARSGAPDDVIEDAWKEALGSTEDSELRAHIHAARGRWLLDRDQAMEAADELAEAVAGVAARGNIEAAAMFRADLARAYLESGRALDSAETAEEALLDLEKGGPEAGAVMASCRFVLANALMGLGDRMGAIDEFAKLAEFHSEHDDHSGAASWHETAGELLDEIDADDNAAVAFEAAAEEFAKADDRIGALRCLRRQVLSLAWAGEVEDGLDVAADARQLLVSLPRTEVAVAWEGAWLAYAESRVLASDRSFESATERIEESIATLTMLAEQGLEGAAEGLEETIAWRETLASAQEEDPDEE